MKQFNLNILRSLIIGLAFSNFITVNAQQIQVKATLDSTKILIGDQVKLHLDITQPAAAKVQIPNLTDKIEGVLEPVQIIKADTLRDKNVLNIKFEYLVTSFDSGDYKIDGIRLPYLNDNKVDTVVSNPLSLSVMNIDVDTAKVVLDIKPPLNTPLNFAEIWPYTSIFMLLALIVALVWVFINRKQKKSAVEIIKRKEPPHIVALRDLDKLRAQKLWQNNKVKSYYIELTEIIRKYIEERFSISALEMTSEEIFEAFHNVHYVDSDSKKLLNELFSIADMVKFAKAQPLPDENEVSMLNGYQFINNTKQIDLPEENKQEESPEENQSNS